jgi:hypothetical protein
MLLKIVGKSEEEFQWHLNSILNIATVVLGRGRLPTDIETSTPEQNGRYWFREENRFHLYPIANDYWANIREESGTHIALYFSCRYYRTEGPLLDALLNTYVALFPDNVIRYTNENLPG